MKREHRRYIFFILLGGSLLLSIVFYLLMPTKLEANVLFFPGATNQGIESELHFLPRNPVVPERAKLLASAMLGGPLSFKFKRLAPPGSQVVATYFVDGILWVNLSSEFQLGDGECPLSPHERLTVLRKAIKFNIHEAEKVVFLIQGKEVRD